MPRVSQHPSRLRAWRFAAPLVIALTFPTPGPAKTPPPTTEIDAAQVAILRAERADAEHYANEALLRARAALAQAQAALAARRKDDAVAQARLAAAEADYAQARSREIVQQDELARRRAEIVELRQKLDMAVAP